MKIAHHDPSFNLFVLHNSFKNQGSKVNNKRHFFMFRHTETNLHLDIARNISHTAYILPKFVRMNENP